MSTSPDQSKTYQGRCHCGLIKYTATLPEALAPEGKGKVVRCNCSICTKNGYFLVFPQRTDVHFVDDSTKKMKSYYMGTKQAAHRFCPECSSSIMVDYEHLESRRHILGMNASLFKDIDLANAEVKTYDGKNLLEPKYED